mmetsp:Transcript_57206/g.69896  ORF Transcript_57206/g.69896 Transcript_57206/m.69896 type:complete len:278 (+) Transcript_57206:116-949(+)
MEDVCQSFVVAASAVENEAIALDRSGDVKGALAKYEESQNLLQRAIENATAAHAADRPKLEQHRREVLERIQHLKSLRGTPSNIPVEDQIRAVQLGMQATTAAGQATSAAGGAKQLAAVAAVGAVGGAVVLGSALGLATVGAVGGAAAAGVAATRSDQVGDVARGVGAMAIKGYDKARDLDREHDISGKVMEAGSKAATTAGAINEKYGITDKVSKGVHAAVAKAQEVEEKHHVSSKVASGIAFGFSKAAQGFDKLTEAASGRRSQITDSAGGQGST